jgi:hypothetical protein
MVAIMMPQPAASQHTLIPLYAGLGLFDAAVLRCSDTAAAAVAATILVLMNILRVRSITS